MIFNKRNDSNQISNLINFNSRENPVTSNFSSYYSEISENCNNERSIDLHGQEDSIISLSDSQISEYGVQKTMPDIVENRQSDYESRSSMFNFNKFDSNKKTLDFLNSKMSKKLSKDIFRDDNENKLTKFNFVNSSSKKMNLMKEFVKSKAEANQNAKYLMDEILKSDNSENIGIESNHTKCFNFNEELKDFNTEKSNINLVSQKDIPKYLVKNDVLKNNQFDSSKEGKNKTLKDNILNSVNSNSSNNTNNSRNYNNDADMDDLVSKIFFNIYK